RLTWAADAGIIGAGVGAAVAVGVGIHLTWRHLRFRWVVALLAAAAAASSAVSAIGTRDVNAMAAGVRAGCAMGLGQCEVTGKGRMPLLLDVGPVQRHPVIRVIDWGATPAERRVVDNTERQAPSLAQPLLQEYYGVQPATDGGEWVAPGDPRAWLREHHQPALTPGDLAALIRRARAAEKWPDNADTQYWLATDLTAEQIGIGPGACADHVHVPGVAGGVVRLPFGSCTLPAGRPAMSAHTGCRPLAVVQPHMNAPATIQAGIEIFAVHEFSEAATDPSNGWTILASARCHGDPLLEIADVCEPDGSLISAPAWNTPAGWQPSLLEPPRHGHPARCVDPARPGRP
ncbi:MAG TPA: hypothetical protein VFN68_09610, partial [Acidimicrobiales bacterium]|nr:hypothetical protein [Acidimicrobiales bacterium]